MKYLIRFLLLIICCEMLFSCLLANKLLSTTEDSTSVKISETSSCGSLPIDVIGEYWGTYEDNCSNAENFEYCYEEAPPFNQGDVIKVEVTSKGDLYIDDIRMNQCYNNYIAENESVFSWDSSENILGDNLNYFGLVINNGTAEELWISSSNYYYIVGHIIF